MTDDRIKFDIACALSIVSQAEEIPSIFPERRTLSGRLEKILADCVDPGSYKPSSCKLRPDVPQTDEYSLHLGTDRLTLAPGGSIILGGAGVTVQLQDSKIKRFFALKVPRVTVLAYKETEFLDLDTANFQKRFSSEVNAFENERTIFRRLSHQNVAQHVLGSVKRIARSDGDRAFQAMFPFSISEWIDGALPLHEYLRTYLSPTTGQAGLSLTRIISLIEQSFAALAHLQDRKIQHWDIKCDNLLVSKDHIVKLIDFGNAKKLDLLNPADDLIATTTKDKYPPLRIFKKEDTGQSESRRFRLRLPDLDWNHPYIDMWMLAQEWNRCLNLSQRFLVPGNLKDDRSQPSPAERKKLHDLLVHDPDPKTGDRLDCIRVIFDRLLFPFDRHRYVDGFIDGVRFKPADLYYGAADSFRGALDVVAELRRVCAPFGDSARVPELLVSLDDIVRLPVTGNSVFTRRIQAIAESNLVEPTQGHNQLGQVKRVFPGASHSRYEHLLGTVATATQFVRSLYLNEMNAFWRISVEAADIDAVLLAAILHDVGHIAYGHFVEEMNDLFAGLKHTDYMRAVLERCLSDLRNTAPAASGGEMFDIPAAYIGGLIEVLKEHWVLASDLRPGETLESRVGALIEQVLMIFQSAPVASTIPRYLSRAATRSAINSILGSIVDGPLDADKLDYLRRDALHSGVLFASGIDLERFFESLRVCVETSEVASTTPPAIGVSEKGIAPTESIVAARYHLFSVMYWHRTTRGITATLQRILNELLLVLDDAQWRAFLRDFLREFRQRDDNAALEWLGQRLSKTKVKSTALPYLRQQGAEARKAKDVVLSKIRLGAVDRGATTGTLLSALRGKRSAYFKVAFELSYAGAIFRAGRLEISGRERLHEQICKLIYPPGAASGIENIAKCREQRTKLAEFRSSLETTFQEKIHALGFKAFQLDTILLDVPEPGKDQISTLHADRRTKRSQASGEFVAKLKHLFPNLNMRPKPDFTEIRGISPIAGSLDHALDRWARKIRIFMAPDDMAKLDKHFARGEVALLWEHILLEKFNILDEDQAEFRLEPSP